MKTLSLQKILGVFIMLNVAFAACEGIAFSAQKSRPINDDTIVDHVRIKLADDPIVKGGALSVECKRGVVTLTGAVETEKAKDRAERLAKKVKGVKQVVNNITIKERTAGSE
jgi:hyperosmotically inducible protein